MNLTFTEFIPSKLSAAGKPMPAKAKASDGKTYTLNRSVIDQIENALGTPLDCTVTTKTNESGGKTYTNYIVESAKHVAATAPVSAPVPTPVSPPHDGGGRPPGYAQERAAPSQPSSTWRPRDPSESLSIVRQVAIKAAVELVSSGKVNIEDLYTTAAGLVKWVYEALPDVPKSQALHHLDDIREKVADIRAGYSDEDAVCPACGRKEFLKQWSQGWFCARSKEAGVPGGCGHPEKGSRLDAPVSYGEWKTRTAATSVPWK